MGSLKPDPIALTLSGEASITQSYNLLSASNVASNQTTIDILGALFLT